MTADGTGKAKVPALRAVLSVATYLLEFAAVAVGYFGLADTATLFPAIDPAATPLWPPTGIALALILLRGYHLWPAILVGSFFASAISSDEVTASSLLQPPAIAMGTTLAALAGAWLINRWSHGSRTLTTAQGVGTFALFCFVPTAILSSAVATAGMLLAGGAVRSNWIATWITWWLADAAGTLLVAPVILLWATRPIWPVTQSKLLETTAIVVLSAAIGVVAFCPLTLNQFDDLLPHREICGFLVLLPLMWAGLRGNQTAAATAALAFCGLAVWYVSATADTISVRDLNGSLLFLFALSVDASVAPLVLGAVVATESRKEERLIAGQKTLGLELQQAQAALKTAKRHFQIFVEDVVDYAIFVLDTSGRVASWNTTAQRIIGYEADEIVGKHFSILYRPDERRAGVPNRALELAAKDGKHEVEGWRIKKDGSPFFVTGALTALRDDNSRLIGFASVMRDATERRDTQEKLVEVREQLAMAQKMEAIGKLTGGIAHDFNNLLMIIGGNAQTFKKLLDPKLPRAIEAIQTAAKRGESLTRQLLTFSRRQHLTPTVIALNDSIRNMRAMIESSLRGNIVYEEKLSPDLWRVKVDLAELELAIVNIAVNARDAMPNGGTFTIAADNRKKSVQVAGIPRTKDFVEIRFTDTGVGIPPDLLSKIFDPFFTTKDVGKGTGLGLSQVYGFAHQAGGTVQVDSKVGAGTTITILLPSHAGMADDSEDAAKADTARPQRPVVLVVDDSAEVAEVTSSLFEHLGYDTVYRDSADAALKLLADGAKIDLVFSDIVMPGMMDGVGLASEVRSQYPHLPVILTTGYSDAAQGVPPDMRILRKPFDADALKGLMQNMAQDMAGETAAPAH